MNAKVIGSNENGEGITWHATGSIAGYHTLCGLSLNDDYDQIEPENSKQKITCKQCLETFLEARRFRITDFRRTASK